MQHATSQPSRWSHEPGYLAAIEDPHLRRRHRNAVRAAGLREERSGTGEPSHHQMCTVILDSMALMLSEDGTRGPAMAAAFRQALRHVCHRDGVDVTHAFVARVERRVTPSKEHHSAFYHSLKRQRSAEAVAAARDEAKEERRRHLVALRTRRHGLDALVPEVDDPFDLVDFGGDKVEE